MPTVLNSDISQALGLLNLTSSSVWWHDPVAPQGLIKIQSSNTRSLSTMGPASSEKKTTQLLTIFLSWTLQLPSGVRRKGWERWCEQKGVELFNRSRIRNLAFLDEAYHWDGF